MSPATSGPGVSRPVHRRKRSQVVQACDWCRQHRVKCDSHYPCSNCQNRGEPCSNEVTRADTLPLAHREIQRLRSRIQALELELREERGKTRREDNQVLQSSISLTERTVRAVSGHGHTPQRKSWGGIYTSTARSSQKTWYGPSSLFYFIGRINNFLTSALQQLHSEDCLSLNTSSKILDEPTATHEGTTREQRTSSEDEVSNPGSFLTPMQEEYFIDLFWSSYHTSLLPILDEAEFKHHYQSLWTTAGNTRKPSALVDIVVAISMQYGVSMLRQQVVVDSHDATIAGRWHYRRSQTLLARELESPTISVLQCQLLSCIYLCFASFQNLADGACGLAVRLAYMLGVHLDPPETMPQQQREMRRRIWWALYTLDSKIGMKLGRPFLLTNATAPLPPADSLEVAMQSGSSFAPLGDNLTWLSFNVHHSKLFQTARTVHSTFYERDPTPVEDENTWDGAQNLAAHAKFVDPYMKLMEDWNTSVPAALKTRRQNNGIPFSTDGSSLEIEPIAPLWLQRQRLLLELTYHHLCCNLCRPFISFHRAPDSCIARIATKCALHAMTLTKITHQVLSSTNILTGWHEAFQLQWNAAVTLVGFMLSSPEEPYLTEARQAIDLSVAVFDIFGDSFAVATSAARIIRLLGAKVDFLKHHNTILSIPTAGETGDPTVLPDQTSELEHTSSIPDILTAANTRQGALGSDEPSAASMQDVLNMAFAVDASSALDVPWTNAGPLP